MKRLAALAAGVLIASYAAAGFGLPTLDELDKRLDFVELRLEGVERGDRHCEAMIELLSGQILDLERRIDELEE